MSLRAVTRDAQYLNILGIKFVARITERTRLDRSAGRVVLWIEPKYDTLAAKILETDRVAILVSGRKIRCLVAYFQHNSPTDTIVT